MIPASASASTLNARLLTVLLAFAMVPFAALAQQPQPVQPGSQPNIGAENAGFGDIGPHDPEQAHMLREMSKDRNAQRQKEIVADTNHLMDLVKQLKAAVDKSNKNELSLSVVNTADEIERLAKTVKDKMRDGQ